jgi:hypothetical protein
LFVALTVACLWLGWQGRLARDQARVVAAIRSVGGIVQYEHQFDRRGNFLEAAEPIAPAWLRRWIGDDFFVTVSQVAFLTSPAPSGGEWTVNTQVTDETLKQLAALPSLTGLSLRADELSDAGLETISHLRQLERLSVSAWKITDAGVAHLARLTRLKGLELLGINLSDESIAAVASLPRLESLQLRGGRMTNAGLAHLRRIRTLRGLTICADAPHIPGTEINGAGLVAVAELSQLENLALMCVRSSDAQLEPLARLTKLRSAWFDMTGVTTDGMAKLQEALPKTALMASDGGGTVWPRPGDAKAGRVMVMPGAFGY